MDGRNNANLVLDVAQDRQETTSVCPYLADAMPRFGGLVKECVMHSTAIPGIQRCWVESGA